MEMEALREAIDTLVEAVEEGGTALGSAEDTIELYRQASRLEAVASAVTAAFERSRDWAADGARSASAWLAVKTHQPKGHCRSRARLGRAASDLPHTAQAWLKGDIGSAHASVMAGLRRPATEEALQRDEEMLVGEARALRFDQFCRAAAYWAQLADPDGAEEDEIDRRGRRDVYLARSLSGMYFGQMTLDPISGAIVSGELDRIYDAMFRSDWAEAKARLGREPTVLDLDRLPAQRRADALVEMAARSATAPADGKRPAPLFSVLVGYETMKGRMCELASGTVVSPGALLPWLDQAYIERAVFRSARRVEVSETSRFFTGATRRALELRDRECTHPYCDLPADRCQADHVIPYTAGGRTAQENGRMACGFHNRLRHQRPPPDMGSHAPGVSSTPRPVRVRVNDGYRSGSA